MVAGLPDNIYTFSTFGRDCYRHKYTRALLEVDVGGCALDRIERFKDVTTSSDDLFPL